MAANIETRHIRCPNCSKSLDVGVPPDTGRTRRVVTRCASCNYDLVVSRGKKEDEPLRIRACMRWDVTCPYCKEQTVARVPPKGQLRRKETAPCRHCRKPLIVERREEGQLVLRAHRGILEGTLL
ncbi:MAG: hypothetical protein OXG27_01020 [Chloroflexi bacterium]|nr:hypothetical protein [Chloroflexota bacterium]